MKSNAVQELNDQYLYYQAHPIEREKAVVDDLETKLAAITLVIDEATAESMQRKGSWSAAGRDYNAFVDRKSAESSRSPGTLMPSITK